MCIKTKDLAVTKTADCLLFIPLLFISWAGSGREIAFVLDGSGSIEPEDFERAKAFIHKMMKTLYEKCFEVLSAVST